MLPLLFASFFVPLAYRCPPAQELVQPWSYRSPSGALELFVDPTESHGGGPATCWMSREGEQIWARTVPFTIVDALVLEDGSVAGFAYSSGLWRTGELIVAVLNPDGSERWVKREPRDHAMPCSVPEPTVRELRACADGFAIEVDLGFRKTEWWTFGWSTGRCSEQRKVQLLDASPTTSPAVELPVPPSIELSMLGRVVFPWPLPLPEVGVQDERRYRQPHRVYVDWQGRVWISEFSSRVVHGFDPDGRPLLDLTPEPWTFRPYRPLEWIAVRGDGRVFVSGDGAVQEFGPADRVGRAIVKDDSLPRWVYLPGTQERWAVEGIGRIQLYGTGGQLLRTVDRGANGRWFQNFYEASVARDGSLAVLDEPNSGISSRDPSTWVHLFGARGEALRSLRVPDEFNGYHNTLAFDGQRIALLHGRLLLLLEENGSPIGRMTFSEELGEPYYLFFSPSGTELWVFPHMRHEMFRFALPS